MLVVRSLVLALLLVSGVQAQETPLSRVAFGSCADEEKPQPIWDAVLAYKPDLFLFAGDNVYGDVRDGRRIPDEDELINGLKESYALATRVPGLAALRASVPHLATWDDHDYGKNDAGADFAFRDEAQKLFLNFWTVPPSDERHRRQGVYHAQTFGPSGRRLQVILLDTRFFRSPLKVTDQRGAPGRERYVPDDDPAKTMLGADQWAWLATRLREPADVRLVISSVQVLAEGHGWERWGNLPRERQRLYDLVRDSGVNGVIFLSGDRHVGAIYRETAGTPYAFIELTSASYETSSTLLDNLVGAGEEGRRDREPKRFCRLQVDD